MLSLTNECTLEMHALHHVVSHFDWFERFKNIDKGHFEHFHISVKRKRQMVNNITWDEIYFGEQTEQDAARRGLPQRKPRNPEFMRCIGGAAERSYEFSCQRRRIR